MITTGVTGQLWRASVTPWGAVEPWGGTPSLNWYVAADDRWHLPADEPTVRQVRVEGTAVVETRVRVPSGDVVQRVYTVADGGGLTVVEIENESTLPVAIAFDRRDVLTERPIVDMPIEGIALPPGAFALPLGHRASLRVAIPHNESPDGQGRGKRGGPLPTGLPTYTQVVNGWLSLTQRASRFVLPEGDRWATLAERVTAERCELVLGSIPRSEEDPAGFAIALGELVRIGENPDDWLPELVSAVERVGPVFGWSEDAALVAAARVLWAAGETRGRRDLRRISIGRSHSARPASAPDGVRLVPWLETLVADGDVLLPHGLPEAWLGHSVETYGVPISDATSVSLALRWHGARPAVLWEQIGQPVNLTSPCAAGWSSNEAKGETLWPAPATAPVLLSNVSSALPPASDLSFT